jgi:N4-gp56 family major capsid protein
MTMNAAALSLDQEKYLVAKLLDRSYINLVMASMCDKLSMKEGAGRTAFMVRYQRMNVPVATLTEGTTPADSVFSLQEVTVTLDQWGDWIEVTDVAELTTKHPVIQEATRLLADNAARVMDREITVVMLAGTNVIFGDGTPTARSGVDATMVVTDALLKRARALLTNDGAPPFGGPAGDAKEASKSYPRGSGYMLVCGPEVVNQISNPSVSYGTFVTTATHSDPSQLVTGEVAKWINFRIVESNFIPRFTRLGNTTEANASGSGFGVTGLTVTAAASGGSLTNGTYFYKVTRKNLLRGFEEEISIAHSTASGGGTASYTFVLPSTAGFVYNIYFDKTAGGGTNADSNLGLAFENAPAGATRVVTAIAGAATAAPPQSINNNVSLVHPIFIVAQSALAWCGFYKTRMLMSTTGATKDDPLAQRRTLGYKFFGKAVIKDQTRLLRLEVADA